MFNFIVCLNVILVGDIDWLVVGVINIIMSINIVLSINKFIMVLLILNSNWLFMSNYVIIKIVMMVVINSGFWKLNSFLLILFMVNWVLMIIIVV